MKRLLVLVLTLVATGWPPVSVRAEGLTLNQGWSLQSGAALGSAGPEISRPGFDAQGWHDASVPATVLATLVANGVYPDPYFGKNLQTIPGVWPPPFDVSARPMPPLSPFRAAWWYRTQFEVPAEYAGKRVWLKLHGVNYKANVWLNGALVADDNQVRGMYREFEFDVTALARPGETNALAIEVLAPRHRDLAETWVDWNPAPPDRNMGLWRPVTVSFTGPAALRHAYVETDLPLPAVDSADLTVMVEVVNALDRPVSGTLSGRIGEIEFEKTVELAPGETRTVSVSPADAPALTLKDPRLWWPYQVGEPALYDLALDFTVDGEVSDHVELRFGVREIDAVRNDEDFFIFQVNGKNILIRGGGWASDMMFRQDEKRLDAELAYVKQMNLNTLRLEAKIETDGFFDRCDEEGILVIAGWCCCHHWERWSRWDGEDYEVAYASQRDQATRLRSHPSMLAWFNASDRPPPPEVEKTYLQVLEDVHWPNPSVSSADDMPTKVTGPSGVKMTGPYEWVPPVYWYEDKSNGGAFGFNTETSPGPAPPEVESLRAMVGDDHLWPIDDVWNYHAGRGMFGDLDVFTKALNKRYGQARDVYDYARKSQAMTYEGERAMFEAYGREKYRATGVIQWMLNDAWPSVIWHLYDYYLRPGGGFYGTRKACEPLHIQFSYDDRSVVVVNSRYESAPGLTARARILNLDLAEKFRDQKTIDAGPDSATRVMTLPEPEDLSSTYFVKLELERDGQMVSDNFYWLSTRPDRLNWPLTQWYYTPALDYADFQALDTLPPVELQVEARHEIEGGRGSSMVTVTNPSSSLAFMVRLRVMKGAGGEEALPVLWDDNYFSMLPGETKEVRAEYAMTDLAGAAPYALVTGWNAAPGGYR